MSKSFAQPSKGKFVVHVLWDYFLDAHYQVKIDARNLANNRIAFASHQSTYYTGISDRRQVSKVEFEDLEAGDYELTLYTISQNPLKKSTYAPV